MIVKKRAWLAVISLVIGMLLAGCGAGESKSTSGEGGAAASYPERNIEILVGHGAGGGTDQFARAIAKELETILDTNINIVNQEGGAGVVALQSAYSQQADGYTLVADSAFPITTAAGTNEHGLDSFTPIARVQNDTYILWVKKGSFSNIEEFIAAAKKNPGKLKIGGTGALGMDEITTSLFEKETGVDLNFVPMKGSGENHAGLLGGHLDAIFDEPGPANSLYEGEEVTPLLVLSKDKLEAFPNVPTSVEKGWDLTLGNERGFFIKEGADPAIVKKLEDAIKKASETKAYKEYEKASFLDLRPGWMNREDYKAELEKNIKMFEGIVKELQ
ncbi:Bug family tripartite tricarboxylate transporter substrate binding protein [Metabacillus arenae]|uniref:Tripartite tricarboxylate transporter substrate binding protein n=1 Tax=Metabacillus arenae TaxID=2771434 RepID=A0A926NLN4_9BACI|nr:tripartite tricarboxylate transporter substrate binding protein [Metabacillus arenae]MBD1382873.1 tripartite tricarboxylate transporter substrate binding protein [Metabacillus arenae]